MKYAIAVGFLFLVFATLALAFDVTCPIHTYATCYDTGTVHPLGAHKFHCTCGDDIWVNVQ